MSQFTDSLAEVEAAIALLPLDAESFAGMSDEELAGIPAALAAARHQPELRQQEDHSDRRSDEVNHRARSRPHTGTTGEAQMSNSRNLLASTPHRVNVASTLVRG